MNRSQAEGFLFLRLEILHKLEPQIRKVVSGLVFLTWSALRGEHLLPRAIVLILRFLILKNN